MSHDHTTLPCCYGHPSMLDPAPDLCPKCAYMGLKLDGLSRDELMDAALGAQQDCTEAAGRLVAVAAFLKDYNES